MAFMASIPVWTKVTSGPAHPLGHAAAPLPVGQPGRPLYHQVGTEHGDGVVVVGQTTTARSRPRCVVIELRQLLVTVEDADGPLRHQGRCPRVMPLRDHLASHGSPTHSARSMP